MFKWESGRQQSGYSTLKFCSGLWPLPFDMYLLKFPTGCHISDHVDTVTKGRHFRLNIIVRKASDGGDFKCSTNIINLNRIKLFRPDLYTHSVSRINEGTRYVLSVGWVLK